MRPVFVTVFFWSALMYVVCVVYAFRGVNVQIYFHIKVVRAFFLSDGGLFDVFLRVNRVFMEK